MSYQIGKLKFMATLLDGNGELRAINIFDSSRVRHSIAEYKVHGASKYTDDLCLYFFGNYWSRCEYEMVISEWPTQKSQKKADIYEMFIKPNFPLLLSMIDDVSINSAKKWLVEYRKKYNKK